MVVVACMCLCVLVAGMVVLTHAIVGVKHPFCCIEIKNDVIIIIISLIICRIIQIMFKNYVWVDTLCYRAPTIVLTSLRSISIDGSNPFVAYFRFLSTLSTVGYTQITKIRRNMNSGCAGLRCLLRVSCYFLLQMR